MRRGPGSRLAPVAVGLLLALGSASAEPTRGSAEPRRADPPADPAYLRTILESSAALGVGTLWYWAEKEQNALDWDDPALGARLSGSAWRYDNNGFGINFIAHPMTGSAFYVIARSNRLSPGWSFASSFGFSMAWELGIEFKEKVSINDQLVTPGAGVVIGEFAHRLGEFLNDVEDPTAWHRVAQWSFGTATTLHRHWDGVPSGASGAEGDGAVWHRFSWGYGFADSEVSLLPTTLPVHRYRARGEFVDLPGYRLPGARDSWFSNLEVSEMRADVAFSRVGTGLDLFAQSVLAGRYLQRLEVDPERGLSGWSMIFGTNLAYRYRSSAARGFDERWAALHLPGAAVMFWAASGPFRIELAARGNLDFVGMSALAYDAWRVEHSERRGKSILRKQGYFYGWGPSTQWELSVAHGPVQAFGTLLATAVHSDDALDRAQELLTVDERAHSTVVEWDAGLGVRVPEVPLVGSLRYGESRWSSWVEGYAADVRVSEWELGVNATF